MSRTLRISLIVAGLSAVLLAVTPFLIPVNNFRPSIERKASAALGRRVSIGNLHLSLLNRSVWAETLAVGDDPAFSASPFVTATSIKFGVLLMPLIASRTLALTDVAIEGAEVTLLKNAAGRWNYASLGSGGGANDSSINRIAINDVRLIVGSTASQKRSTYDRVNLTILDLSSASMRPVAVTAALPGGGTFGLHGNLGVIDATDASRTPFDAEVSVKGLNLATSGLLEPSSGLGGLVDLKATVASRNGESVTKGTATFSKALLVAGGSPASEPVAVEFETKYNLLTSNGILDPSVLKVGGAVGRVNGTYNAIGEYPVVDVAVAGDHLPARDLESFLPAMGIHVPRGASLAGGTLSAHLNVAGPTNRLVAIGSVGLSDAKLAGFDLGSKTGSIAALAGLHTGSDLVIQTLTTGLRMASDGLRFDHLNAFVPSLGHVNGAGTIDAKNNLDFKMVASLTSHIGGVVGGVVGGAVGGAVGTAGALGGMAGKLTGETIGMLTGSGSSSNSSGGKGEQISFRIEGTTSDPKFVADVGGVVGQMFGSEMSNLHVPGVPSPKQAQPANPLGAPGLRGRSPKKR